MDAKTDASNAAYQRKFPPAFLIVGGSCKLLTLNVDSGLCRRRESIENGTATRLQTNTD
jgi:hypothetical protein